MLKHSRRLIKTIGITGMVIALGISSAFAIGKSGILKNLECGIASTYSSGYQTANGEHYNHLGISAAHKHLPFGTRVIIRHQRSGRSILVRINDRGPFIPGRIIDLSTGAKNAFGMGGLAPVCLEIVSYGQNKRYHAHNSQHHHRHVAKLKHHQHHKHHVHVKHKHHHKHHNKRIYREDQA